MDEQEARSILSLYRAGDASIEDARLEEAVRKAEADPALARWWNEEQELDRIIASKLAGTHVPAGLKERVS